MDKKQEMDYNKLVAEGDYTAVAKTYKEKANSKGTGRNAAIMYVIQEGEFESFAVFNNVNNIVHTSKEAQEIAEKKLTDVLLSVGVQGGYESVERMDIEDLIMDKPVVISVGIEPEREYTVGGVTKTAKARNFIKSVSAL